MAVGLTSTGFNLFIKHNSAITLQSLNISNRTAISNESISILSIHCQFLAYIDMSGLNLEFTRKCHFYKNNPNIQQIELDLQDLQIIEEFNVNVYEMLTRCTQLQSISLFNGNCAVICNENLQMSLVTVLTLDNVLNIDLELLSNQCCNLTTLIMNKCTILPCSNLSQAKSLFNQLKQLSITKPKSVLQSHILDILFKNNQQTLQSITLCQCNFVGKQSFVNSVSFCSELTNINVNFGNGDQSTQEDMLMNITKNCNKLTSIHLGHMNYVQDSVILALTKHSTHLNTFIADSLSIVKPNIFCNFLLSRNKALTKLDITYGHFIDHSVLILLGALFLRSL